MSPEAETAWIDDVACLSGARGAIAWRGDRSASSAGWTVDSVSLATASRALDAIEGVATLEASDERIAPLADTCPERSGAFVYSPETSGSARMLLALGAGEPPSSRALAAAGRLSAASLRPAFDDTWLLEAARLATAGRLAFSLSHDIGTPLNVISGYAEYLLMSVPANDPSRESLSTMLDQTRRIAQMIRQMLDVSRSSSGSTRQRQPSEPFLRDVLQASSYMLRKAGVKAMLEHEIPNEEQIVGDLPRLQLALSTVLLNAARTAGTGGRLVVRAASEAEGVAVVHVTALDATRSRVDLTLGGEGAEAYLHELLASHVLGENGGSLAAVPGDDGVCRLAVRFETQH